MRGRTRRRSEFWGIGARTPSRGTRRSLVGCASLGDVESLGQYRRFEDRLRVFGRTRTVRRIDKEIWRRAQERPATRDEERQMERLAQQQYLAICEDVPEQPPDPDSEAWERWHAEYVAPRM